MVDVSQKPVSLRSAIAEAQIRFPSGLLGKVMAGGGPKGPILSGRGHACPCAEAMVR